MHPFPARNEHLNYKILEEVQAETTILHKSKYNHQAPPEFNSIRACGAIGTDIHGHLYVMDGGLPISENNVGADQFILLYLEKYFLN